MQRARDSLMLLAQVGFFVGMFALLANFSATRASLNVAPGPKGDTAEIDYDKITAINRQEIQREVRTAVEALPKARDGYTPVLGVDYFNGKNGEDAVVDYELIKTFIQEVLNDQTPEPPLEFEYRTNGNGNKERRLIGDDSWQLCRPEDNCP